MKKDEDLSSLILRLLCANTSSFFQKDEVLVSKNPDVTEPRQNLSPKKPHFTLKTGENLTQNLRLKTLIFIVEKYGTKLLLFKNPQ